MRRLLWMSVIYSHFGCCVPTTDTENFLFSLTTLCVHNINRKIINIEPEWMNEFCNHIEFINCFDLNALSIDWHSSYIHLTWWNEQTTAQHDATWLSTIIFNSIFLFISFRFHSTGRALFNPRIEYNNEWRPVGHSDPLKNDPTFDYSPPVLDRVRYWADHSTATGQTNGIKEKKEILVLGVPSKHTVYSHPNHVPQTEPKSSNRRVFYAPQVSCQINLNSEIETLWLIIYHFSHPECSHHHQCRTWCKWVFNLISEIRHRWTIGTRHHWTHTDLNRATL